MLQIEVYLFYFTFTLFLVCMAQGKFSSFHSPNLNFCLVLASLNFPFKILYTAVLVAETHRSKVRILWIIKKSWISLNFKNALPEKKIQSTQFGSVWGSCKFFGGFPFPKKVAWNKYWPHIGGLLSAVSSGIKPRPLKGFLAFRDARQPLLVEVYGSIGPLKSVIGDDSLPKIITNNTTILFF